MMINQAELQENLWRVLALPPALERLLREPSSPWAEVREAAKRAVDCLRARPGNGDDLVNAMLTSEGILRSIAQQSLHTNQAPRAIAAFKLEECLQRLRESAVVRGERKIVERNNEGQVIRITAEEMQSRLTEFFGDPIFVDRMLAYVRVDQPGSDIVARALRHATSHECSLRMEWVSLEQARDSNHPRNSALPYAIGKDDLIYMARRYCDMNRLVPSDPTAIKALIESSNEVNLPEFILNAFYQLRFDKWDVLHACADFLKKNSPEGSDQFYLRDLIAGSIVETGWVLAGRQGSTGLFRCLRTAEYFLTQRKAIHNMRMAAALVLGDAYPELSKKIFLDAASDTCGEKYDFDARVCAELALSKSSLA
jgi:hypothetical protein